MVVSLRKWRKWLQFFAFFFILTMVLYWLLAFLAPYLLPNSMQHEPFGDAVKVVAEPMEAREAFDMDELKDRLFLFYWYGE